MANLNLANMTEAQLDKAYEAAVAHKSQIALEIKNLNNQLIFDKENVKLIQAIAEKVALKNEVQMEIRAIRNA